MTQDSAPTPQLNTLITGMSDAAYRAAPGINQSGLKQLLRSPAHYQAWLAAAPKETPALRMGRLMHMAILEPDRLAASIHVEPSGDRRLKAVREAVAEFRAALPEGSEVVSAAEQETLQHMVAAVRAHTRLRRLLETGVCEASVWWQDPVHDVLCKARYDFVAESTRVICDLKTTQDARYESFSRDMVRNEYSLQAAHYLAAARDAGVAEPKDFVFIAVEKEPPYGIALYRLCPQEHARGAGWRSMAMESYAQCLKTGTWPGYSRDFQVLEAPAWAPRSLVEVPDSWW